MPFWSIVKTRPAAVAVAPAPIGLDILWRHRNVPVDMFTASNVPDGV